jgi:hypothetical protein
MCAHPRDAGGCIVNRRERELLARQLRNVSAAQSEGALGPALLAVFVVGFVLGGLLFTQTGDASRTPGVMASISGPTNGAATVRR